MLLRIVVSVTLLLVAAAPFFAQHPATERKDIVFFNHAPAMHSMTSEGVPDELLQSVKTALNLSDVQVTAVKTLLNMRHQATQQIFQEIEAAHRRLEELAGQSNANANEVGTAFLATRSAQRRLNEAEEKFRTDFQALLNADQRAALARLNSASDQIESLRALGVVNGSFHEKAMAIRHIAPFGGRISLIDGPRHQ